MLPPSPADNPNFDWTTASGFDAAFALVRPALYERAYTLTGDHAEAERLVGQVEHLAFSDRGALPPEKSFSAWCMNLVHAHYSRQISHGASSDSIASEVA